MRVSATHKKCPACGEIKPNSEFWVTGSACKPCSTARTKRWRENHPERNREMKRAWYMAKQRFPLLLQKYGVTEAMYQEMVQAQDGKCAVCLEPPHGPFHVDHHHDTGRVRALLCGPCNRGIGMFRDRPEVLERALHYVRNHRVMTESELHGDVQS